MDNIVCMDWTLGVVAIVMLTAGLIGQAFEMRKIRLAADSLDTANIFADKRNFKWYAILGAGIVLWYVAERG